MPQDAVTAVVLAAGQGARLGAGRNKVFLEVAGRPLLWHALRAFIAEPDVGELVLVAKPGEEAAATDVAATLGREVRVVRGGTRRQDSALAGAEAATGRIVLVHDGARPFPSRDLIRRVLEGARRHGACAPVVAAVHTLRYVDQQRFLKPGAVARQGLFEMQTPQGFEREALVLLLREAQGELPDDAEALLAAGTPVFTVPGEAWNLKVTTRDDLRVAEALAGLLSHGG